MIGFLALLSKKLASINLSRKKYLLHGILKEECKGRALKTKVPDQTGTGKSYR